MNNPRLLPFMLLLLFTCRQLSAQIICTDVNPDITVSGNATQDIDLNNDATPDFRLTSAQVGTLSFVVVQGSQIGTGNSVLSSGSGAASCLPLGAPIGSTSTTWVQMNGSNLVMILVAGSTVTGTWAGATDQYLGLQLAVGSNTYYGWARFTFSAVSNTYIYKDYAYNSLANFPILAGYGCGSLSNPVFVLPNTMCTGNTITLTANTGTAVPNQYAWIASPAGAVFSASTAVTTSLTFTSTGTYTVLLAVISGTQVGFTQNTVSVGFTPTLTSNSPVCSGSALVLSSSTGTAFTWMGPGGYSSNTQTTTIAQASVANAGNYSVVVTSAAGCTAVASASITVNSLPTLSLSPASPSICLGSSVALNVTGTSSLVTWAPNAGLSSSTGFSVVAGPPATIVYTLTGNANGCQSTANVTVDVQAMSQYNLVISTSSFCVHGVNGSPASATLVVGAAPGYSATTANPAGLSGVPVTSLTTVYTPGPAFTPGIYNSTVTISNGICSADVLAPIKVIANPTLLVIPQTATVCSGSTVSIGVAGATSYSWDPSAPGLNNYSAGNVIATPTIATTYSVYGASGICRSSTSLVSVSVLSNPMLAVTAASICAGSPAKLSVNGAANYLWSGPFNFSSTSSLVTTPVFAASGTDVFTVTGSDANSCVSTVTIAIKVGDCTGIEDRSDDVVAFALVPNPSPDGFVVAGVLADTAVIEVMNAGGQLIISGTYNAEERILTGQLESGLYFVKVVTAGRSAVLKFLKE